MAFCDPARVIDVRRLTPHMIRVRLEAIGEWRWPTTGRGDEKIDLAFPRRGETHADIAFFNRADYGTSTGPDEPVWRHYTVRAVDLAGARIDVDFVIHDGGFASDWAGRAEPGHVLGVFSVDESRSYYAPPVTASRQLLVADATGLPGLGRIVEGLHSGTTAQVFVEVAEEGDRQSFDSAADLDITWLIGTGLGLSHSALPATIESWTPPASLEYAWIACEAAASRQVRRHLRTVLRMDRRRHIAVGYWTSGHTGHFEQDERVLDHDHTHEHDHVH
ncbi:siderophore-interacting protein [Microbacterium sp. Root61]|uniref:siderophore-interacting protein n=1 Tax=Microbacterium sp. Root61 TaxID=1736570 RepID=UPI0006F360D9|nr:siderophore-interacting protein [Microbacterium sp. Root61]KRA23597.1 siderophore-interacting protein [Microbacterium sp. Root61]